MSSTALHKGKQAMTTDCLDTTIPCVPATETVFACDINGEHFEIAIPADAWDFENDTVWLTQAQFAELYRVNVPAINKQIQNIFEDEELQEDSVISRMEITAADGELGDSKIFERRINIKDACGVPHPTAIYNLTVLNRLGMCCFRKNRKAKEVRDKFNDVLRRVSGFSQKEARCRAGKQARQGQYM